MFAESEEEESVPEASSNESGGSDFSRAKEASGGRGRGRRGGGRGRGRSRGGVEPTGKLHWSQANRRLAPKMCVLPSKKLTCPKFLKLCQEISHAKLTRAQ